MQSVMRIDRYSGNCLTELLNFYKQKFFHFSEENQNGWLFYVLVKTLLKIIIRE